MGGWRYAWRTEIGDELFTEICTLAEATVVGDPIPTLTQWRAALAAGDPSQLPAPKLRIDWPAQWNRDVVTHVRQRLTPAATVSLACLAQEAIATNWHDEYTVDWATRSQLRWLSETTGHPTLDEAHDLLSDLLPGNPGDLRPLFAEDPDVAPPTATQLILRELISTPSGLGNRSNEELFEFAAPRLNELATIASTLGRPNEVDRGGAYRLISQVLASLSPAEREQQADSLAAPLLAQALSPAAAGRRAAQDAAELLTGTENQVLAAITDRQLDRRIQAADWAARSQVPGAVAALSRAFAKEKTDAGMVAQLDALERLGEPLTSYLSADGLGTRATAVLKKPAPAAIAWYDLAALGTGDLALRWRDGSPVPAEILQYLTVLAVKAKTSTPNALLRLVADQLAPTDRRAWGEHALATWLASDLRRRSDEEAYREAESWAGMYTGKAPGTPEYEAFIAAQVDSNEVRHPFSEVASKGLLAIAAACCDGDAVEVIGRYLKHWYGFRVHQCKALVGVLAWIDDKRATQLLLQVATRFRTRTIEAEARAQVEDLAARRGWTTSQLADRTVPDAGFDAHGRQRFSYSADRTFTAVLRPRLTVELQAPDGQVIKSLPAARTSDDPELVEAAKKALRSARKDVEATRKQLSARWYEAMCSEEAWQGEVWSEFVFTHPVVRFLAAAVIWEATLASGEILTFRPDADGSLTDADDNTLTLPTDALVRVAHGSRAAAQCVHAWAQHLIDHEVSPLFPQMERSGPPAIAAGATELAIAPVVVAHKLAKGRFRARGYERGRTGDGGRFTSYDKDFPALGITAQMDLSDDSLSLGDGLFAGSVEGEVAISRVSFVPLGVETGRFPLPEIPEILLAEAWHDLSEIAGGT